MLRIITARFGPDSRSMGASGFEVPVGIQKTTVQTGYEDVTMP